MEVKLEEYPNRMTEKSCKTNTAEMAIKIEALHKKRVLITKASGKS